MHIFVDIDNTVSLREPDAFQSFKLVVRHSVSELPAVREALRDIADPVDETHAWVSTSWLRKDGARARPSLWQEQFETLLAYAGGKGWVDPTTGNVRGHIEWKP